MRQSFTLILEDYCKPWKAQNQYQEKLLKPWESITVRIKDKSGKKPNLNAGY